MKKNKLTKLVFLSLFFIIIILILKANIASLPEILYGIAVIGVLCLFIFSYQKRQIIYRRNMSGDWVTQNAVSRDKQIQFIRMSLLINERNGNITGTLLYKYCDIDIAEDPVLIVGQMSYHKASIKCINRKKDKQICFFAAKLHLCNMKMKWIWTFKCTGKLPDYAILYKNDSVKVF